MKEYKEFQVPAKTEKRLMATYCDICKERIFPDMYDASEVVVSCKTGSAYPDNGSGEEKTCDICVKCFNTKVVPALENLGAKFVTTEWEY